MPESRAHLEKVVALLETLGFFTNWKKSITEPVQTIGFRFRVKNFETQGTRIEAPQDTERMSGKFKKGVFFKF